MNKSTIVAGLVACAIGCSSDGGGSLTPTQFQQQEASAYCTYYVRCGLYADQASCLANANTTPDSAVFDAINAGKVTWNGGDAQSCLDAIESLSCDQTSMGARVEPSACLNIVTGVAATGSACEQDAECVSGECALTTCGSACCPGTCTGSASTGAVGEPCIEGDTCAAGNWCDESDTGSICQALVASGSACQASASCPYGQGCGGGICKVLPQVGQPCPDNVCADIGAYCGSAGTCLAYGLSGAACGSGTECSPFETCDTTSGKCAALPTVGQPCTDECSNATCDNGTCVAPGSDGTTCMFPSDCQSDNCVIDENGSGTCTAESVCI